MKLPSQQSQLINRKFVLVFKFSVTIAALKNPPLIKKDNVISIINFTSIFVTIWKICNMKCNMVLEQIFVIKMSAVQS